MLKGPAKTYRIRHSLLQGICGAALANAMILPAAAQESTAPVTAEEENPDDIVVTGIRANLESAQNRKRNADTVVDSITAEDIGSFPDKSVAEALQRVPGITVVRVAGTHHTTQL